MPLTNRTKLGQSAEDYLKAIYKLQDSDVAVTTSLLAKALGVSAAASTKAVQLLAQRELVQHTPYRGVSLTEMGRKTALDVIRHHRLLELFLHDILGYGWDEVDVEAERLEHHVSEKFIAGVDRLLNYPRFDPHGSPIPTSDGHVSPRRGRSLADCEPDDRVTIAHVRDDDPEVLKYLDRLGMRPGASIEVIDRQPFDGPLTLRIKAAGHAVGADPVVRENHAAGANHAVGMEQAVGTEHSVGRKLAGHVFVMSPDSNEANESNESNEINGPQDRGVDPHWTGEKP